MAITETGDRKSKVKLGIAVGVFLLAIGFAWYNLSGNSLTELSTRRMFICAETGRAFEYNLEEGEIEPIRCPCCKKNNGWRAEACYWVKDENGEYTKAKTKPTYVLLKRRLNPESNEKTYCPDCGREVAGHNPMPPQELMDAAAAEGR